MQSSVNNKIIAKNTFFLYIRTIVILLISLYTSRVVLDSLGETDFGIYNLVGGVIVLFAFMTDAMSSATQRYLSYEIGKNNISEAHRIFSMSISIHIMIAVIVFVLGETIGLWFVLTQLNIPVDRQVAAMWVYQLSLIGCCLGIWRIPYNASVICYERMSFYAYISIIEALLRLGIVWLLAIFEDRLVVYAIFVTTVIFIMNVIYYVYCHKNFSICHYNFFWDKILFKKLMSFSGWSMFGSISNVGVNQGLNILLNIFYGVIVNAALGIANQVQGAIASFIFSFQTAFTPQMVKLFALRQKGDFFKLICRSSRLSYCLIFLIAPAMLVCLDSVLNLWLTSVPAYTKPFVMSLILYSIIDSLSGPLWIAVRATGDIRNYQLLMSALIVLNLPVMYIIMATGFSPIVAVAIRPCVNIVTHIVRIYYLKQTQDFPSNIYWKDVMLRCFLMTLISIPLCLIVLKVILNRTILMTMLSMSIIIIQNIILVSAVGLKASEREMVFKFIYSKYVIRMFR